MRFEKSYLGVPNSDLDYGLLSVEMYLDENITTISRSVTTIFDALS